jgi:hypothetical protein
MWVMFVPHWKHICGPRRPVTGIAVLYVLLTSNAEDVSSSLYRMLPVDVLTTKIMAVVNSGRFVTCSLWLDPGHSFAAACCPAVRLSGCPAVRLSGCLKASASRTRAIHLLLPLHYA